MNKKVKNYGSNSLEVENINKGKGQCVMVINTEGDIVV
jgi:hypothetical protein